MYRRPFISVAVLGDHWVFHYARYDRATVGCMTFFSDVSQFLYLCRERRVTIGAMSRGTTCACLPSWCLWWCSDTVLAPEAVAVAKDVVRVVVELADVCMFYKRRHSFTAAVYEGLILRQVSKQEIASEILPWRVSELALLSRKRHVPGFLLSAVFNHCIASAYFPWFSRIIPFVLKESPLPDSEIAV
eukprot:gb/GECG01008083.1/.p1 GENE.gb/GECG01008083.1/~~gb/GECG01008083.1/.p1  ORF type:complete len:188 (+),score=4.19 gb/GECG01008083.1/:1-564(+)